MDSTAIYSWMGAITVGGLLFAYYTNGSRYFMQETPNSSSVGREGPQAPVKRRRQEKDTTKQKKTSASEKVESYAQAASSAVQEATSTKKRKAGRAANIGAGTDSQSANATSNDEEDTSEEYGDKELARQLEARKKGVTLERSSGPGRANRSQVRPLENDTGAKPLPTPKDLLSSKEAGDVSDMLEAKTPGPSVIRITGEEKAKKQHAPKEAQAKETKKQRQNRKKVEEQKAQREEDEKRRKVMEEQQRRTAREARGEPAKNGIASAKPPATNAWSSSAQSSATQPAPAVKDTQLLDTFDHDELSTSSSNDAHTNSTTPATAASIAENDLPSEEVQMEMLNEMNGWNEVSSKKGKKKDKPSAQASPPNGEIPAPAAKSSAPAPSKTSNPYSAIATSDLVNGSSKPSKISSKAKADEFPSLAEATTIISSNKGHPEDSDWAA